MYFSEKILRSSGVKIENLCAKEYVSFIVDSNYFSKEFSYLISFIPNRCKTNICDFALSVLSNSSFSSSHVFIDSMLQISSSEEFYSVGKGVSYVKD